MTITGIYGSLKQPPNGVELNYVPESWGWHDGLQRQWNEELFMPLRREIISDGERVDPRTFKGWRLSNGQDGDVKSPWRGRESKRWQIRALFGMMLVNNELSAYLLRWYQKWSLIGCSYVPAYEGACMCRSSAHSQADWWAACRNRRRSGWARWKENVTLA